MARLKFRAVTRNLIGYMIKALFRHFMDSKLGDENRAGLGVGFGADHGASARFTLLSSGRLRLAFLIEIVIKLAGRIRRRELSARYVRH